MVSGAWTEEERRDMKGWWAEEGRIIKKQLKKGVIKKQLKKVDKAIVEIAEMKFENYEEKEEKLDALVFLKNQILTEARELL